MKIKYLFILLVLVSIFSCKEEDLLIPPNSSLSEETAYKNVGDLQTAINAVYTQFNNRAITFNSIFTDNTKIGQYSGGQQTNLHGLVMNADNGTAANIWRTRYTAINRANRIIDVLDNNKIEVEESEQAAVNKIKAQAYALRALAHFELFQYFTEDYTNSASLCVPAVTTIVSTEELPRNTVGEVLALINSDLSAADGLLSDDSSDNAYVSKDFITALKARMALFTGDYGTAMAEANKLIAAYPLADKTQYKLMFLDSDNTEVIFKLKRVIGNARIGNIWNFRGGNAFIEMSNSFLSKLMNGDVRREVNVDLKSDGSQNIKKYPGTSVEYLADYKYFRVSEMYLIKAEAQIDENKLDDAAQTFKAINDARYGEDTEAPSFGSKQAAMDYLLAARRVELAYEGHRWLDLKRLKQDLIRSNEDCGSLNDACTLSSTDRRFTLPIPQAEIDANENMVQNSGY